MIHNFTIFDIVGSVEAALLTTIILFIPGYVIGWVSNVFKFRQRRLITQALLSTPLAVAVLPILVYLIGRHPRLLWSLLGFSWIGFAMLVPSVWKRRSTQRTLRIPKSLWVGAIFAGLWSVVAISSLMDLQFGHRLYFSTVAYDLSFRTALTAATSNAIPPSNPFFASVPPVRLRYHYFWMLVCGLVTHLGVGPRQAMLGGTVWAGFTLMCLIAILLKFFIDVRERLEQKVVIACGLLAVTGLDILPTVLLYFRYHLLNADMEWWNEQISSWVDTLLWAPHHLMGLVACMVGLLALRQGSSRKLDHGISIAIAGLAFASAVGLSILVTFTFAAFVALWLPYAALRRWWDDLLNFFAAGVLAVCLAWPFLLTLSQPATDGTGGGGPALALKVRGFPLAIDHIASFFQISPLKLSFLRLPLLPLNYFLELGFLFFVGALRLRSVRAGSTPLTRNEETGWMMVVTSLLVGSFLRSTTVGSNDLGWRCFLQAQLILSLWAAFYVDDWWSVQRFREGKGLTVSFAAILLGLGLIGTTYQVIMLRIYPILLDEGRIRGTKPWWLDYDNQLGERNYALRSAYEKLSLLLPRDAIVQYNPSPSTFISNRLYSSHDAAMGDPFCGAMFGGNADQCKMRAESIVPLFEGSSPTENAAVDDVCRQYGISVVLVADTDPVWRQSDSWAWTRTPMVANNRVRAFACGDQARQARLRTN